MEAPYGDQAVLPALDVRARRRLPERPSHGRQRVLLGSAHVDRAAFFAIMCRALLRHSGVHLGPLRAQKLLLHDVGDRRAQPDTSATILCRPAVAAAHGTPVACQYGKTPQELPKSPKVGGPHHLVEGGRTASPLHTGGRGG